ncbi:MAG: BREX-1 system adenine-specific DNA-methyltransferase PglX [Pseudomonadota bacterium]
MESQAKSQLKGIVLKLRHILEGHYDTQGGWHPGDIEERLAFLGFRRDRSPLPLESLSHLDEADLQARRVADAYVQDQVGWPDEKAVAHFVQETAYTWANRLIALRCMEARGLIDEIILQKESYGGRSLKHHRLARQNPAACAGEDDGLYIVLAEEFARRADDRLRQLFDPHDPLVALRPGVAALKQCIGLLSAPDEVFNADDALGWAYQYWNTEEKNRVFDRVRTVKGAKIANSDIIAATQLYTEPYMVKYLVQNSLGALWMAMHPDSRLCRSWEYYVHDADRAPAPVKSLVEITFLDPCVGSGHFLLEAFDLLYAMYLEAGQTDPDNICDAILTHNLFGIDIDERAIQIAGLALYMKAREKAPEFRPTRINLVATNVHAASNKDHLAAFLKKHPDAEPLKAALGHIFDSLVNAGELGSLLQIEEPVEKEFQALKNWHDTRRSLAPQQIDLFLQKAKPGQKSLPLGGQSYDQWKDGILERLSDHFRMESAAPDFTSRFFGETAEKGLTLFDFLSRRYDVVATNPPYMGSKNMGPVVKHYVESRFVSGKRDLYAAFILRCLELAKPETGRVAMVTQQSWMFLRSFVDLRALDASKLATAKGFTGILRETSIEAMAHLGPGAFEEISGEVVNTVLFCVLKKNPSDDHRLTAYRLVGYKSPDEKDCALKVTNPKTAFTIPQTELLNIEEFPFIYWVPEQLIDLIRVHGKRTDDDYMFVTQGLTTGNVPRFVRFVWECSLGEGHWWWYTAGGGYKKWTGNEYLFVDWQYRGARLRSYVSDNYPPSKFTLLIKQPDTYGQKAVYYGAVARGALGVRLCEGAIFGDSAPGIIHNKLSVLALSGILNTRLYSFLIRALSATILTIRDPYVVRLPIYNNPLPDPALKAIESMAALCVFITNLFDENQITERKYFNNYLSSQKSNYLYESNALLHLVESCIEMQIVTNYALDTDAIALITDETGLPSGWFPLIQGYDALPPLPEGLPEIPQEVIEFLGRHERRTLDPEALILVQNRLRTLFESGPGAKEEAEDTDADTQSDDDENEQVAVGARIPIPAETFLEELSQKLEVHPISVYWFLKTGIEKEGWRCRSEEQRLTRDGFTVTILSLLGHRWPRQVEADEPVPGWAAGNGVIPLSEGTEEIPLYQRLRDRLATEFGDEQVSAQENAFAEIMGKPLQKWILKDFFRHHISRFKKRPIAWHLSSNGGSRQASAFEGLVYYHRTDGDMLPKIRSQFIGPLIKRLERELHSLETVGTLNADQESRKTTLKNQIPELKTFDRKLAKVVSSGFGPDRMLSLLRQCAINDAVLCLKARWLRRLQGVIHTESLSDWQKQAEATRLHVDFPVWIAEAFGRLDQFCATAGPRPPQESGFDEDPTAKELANWICSHAAAIFKDALMLACNAWWKPFNAEVLAPIAQSIKDAKSQLQALNDQAAGANPDFTEQSNIQRKTKELKDTIKQWRKVLTDKTLLGQALRSVIETWTCTEALEWEPWLAEQLMFDQLSSLGAHRPSPQTIQDFVRQESLYQPDINDGVRVNIAPLQSAGLLTANVLAGKDVAKAITDRATWRDDERRWCREGKLPRPGWWA